jgi:thioredoxin reductase
VSSVRPTVQLIGRAFDPKHYRLRDFLTRIGRRCEFFEQARPLALETTVPGLFAAGDLRSGSTKRVAGAVGEGAMAAALAYRRLQELAALD